MSRNREPMRKIKTVLRLAQHEQLSERQIARAAHMRRSTVRDYLARARAAHLTWSDACEMGDAEVTIPDASQTDSPIPAPTSPRTTTDQQRSQKFDCSEDG